MKGYSVVAAALLALGPLSPAPAPGATLPRLDACGRFFCRTDTGAVTDYREASAFALYSRWLKGESDAVTQFARGMRAEGVTSLRVLLTLGGSFWDDAGFHLGPDLGERFYDGLGPFVDALGREGMYVRLTFIGALEPLGGTVPDRGDHYTPAVHARARVFVARVVELTSTRPHVLFEIANEWDHIGMANSADRIVELGQLVKALAPESLLNLTNTSAGFGGHSTWAREPADFVDSHLARDTNLDGFAWLLDVGALPVVSQERMPYLSGEPINFGSSGVGGGADHERSTAVACAYGAVSRIAQFYTTFHYDDGLWAKLPDETTMATLSAWRRCLDAVPFEMVGPGTRACDGTAECSPWTAEALPASTVAEPGYPGPLRVVGRVGPAGYIGVSLREPAGRRHEGLVKPGRVVDEVLRVEHDGWATVIRTSR